MCQWTTLSALSQAKSVHMRQKSFKNSNKKKKNPELKVSFVRRLDVGKSRMWVSIQ